MDNDQAAQTGNSLISKDDGLRMPEDAAKARKEKLLRKGAAEPKNDESMTAQKEDATAGDDFYAGVLERFGIQI